MVTDVLKIVDSTNDYTKQHLLAHNSASYVCLAEQQTAARGRYGKLWHSGNGNLNLSRSIKFDNITQIQALSLAVGSILIDFLHDYLGLKNIFVKWPNDVLYIQDNKYHTKAKLAGILIELVNYQYNYAVVGIGVNIQPAIDANIQQEVISLQQILNRNVNINKFIVALLKRLNSQLELFLQQGFSSFQAAWNHYNAFKNNQINILKNGKVLLSGRCIGVNIKGELIIKTAYGIELFNDSSCSVRLAG